LNATAYTEINGRPVAGFEVQILDLSSGQATPVPSIEDSILNNVESPSKDIVSLQQNAAGFGSDTQEAQPINKSAVHQELKEL
jgi:hypothetical protein